MPIGIYKQASDTEYYAFNGTLTEANVSNRLDGEWHSSAANVEAAEFNSPLFPEQVKTTLIARSHHTAASGLSNGDSVQARYEITLMVSDSGDVGSFVSAGLTHSFSIASAAASSYPTSGTGYLVKTLIFQREF